MHRLAAGFVLGYHGCDRGVGERLLSGEAFVPSENDYDWLGHGIYFWESSPLRALQFAQEASRRSRSSFREPFVVGAIIEMALCLDLTTANGIAMIQSTYAALVNIARHSGLPVPRNGPARWRRRLDCAVINHVHQRRDEAGLPSIDTVRGVFTEGGQAYPDSGFFEKTHVQIAVCNAECIKGVFRVAPRQLQDFGAA